MKANELRVGNWVIFSGSGKGCITKEDFSFYGLEQITFPIKLAKEWLINLGFERESDEDIESYEEAYNEEAQDILWFKGNVVLMQSKHDGTFSYPIRMRHGNPREYKSAIVVLYVHQLQNLYFALDGEELVSNDN